MHMRSFFPEAARILAMALILVISLWSCTHKYDSNELDLAYYQWNKWHDQEADEGNPGEYMAPVQGWDAFNRGTGELVRIPSEVSDPGGVAWYHCRFTLPEQWEERPISLVFEGVQPVADIYLNEILVGSVSFSEEPIEIEVTSTINYTLDNHLAVRVVWQEGSVPGDAWGVTGGIIVRSDVEIKDLPK